MQIISSLLEEIYGAYQGKLAFVRITDQMAARRSLQKPAQIFFSQQDVILITYGDSLKAPGKSPLTVLKCFADRFLSEIFSMIHILPFFPSSSDDGFAVKDFSAVDPQLGTWDHVIALQENFDLMFDWVLNHISAQSIWFDNYLRRLKGFGNLAIEVDQRSDLSQVVRPRAQPLLTPFEKYNGQTVHLWTTFSSDQIDLNYASIDVLMNMLEILLLYVQKGAAALRLDAVAYLWKQIGTGCIHLPKTHALVRLFRAVLDQVAPAAALLTETNVPHEENLSYFGDGRNEAQMVYNFSLPPLLAYTLIVEDSRQLSRWASKIKSPSLMTTFLNFTASHDGIGLRPLEGILSNQELAELLRQVEQNGGRLSYRNNPDGTKSPYEMNITYLDLLHRDSDSEELHIARFLASQSIALAMPGVPGIYIHSLLASRNWQDGVLETGRARSINREKLDYGRIIAALKNPDSLRAKIFCSYCDLIKIRRRQPAFHPHAAFETLDLGPKVFALKRYTDEQKIYALTNVSSETIGFSLAENVSEQLMRDLLTQRDHPLARIKLLPYQTLWLTS